jgi:hypothetical protein
MWEMCNGCAVSSSTTGNQYTMLKTEKAKSRIKEVKLTGF